MMNENKNACLMDDLSYETIGSSIIIKRNDCELFIINQEKSVDRFKIKIFGRGAHSSMPQNSKDPVMIASCMLTAISRVPSELLNPAEVKVICNRFDSGTTFNIIPDTGEIEGAVTANDEKVRAYIALRVLKISDTLARTFGARATVEYDFKNKLSDELTELIVKKLLASE